MQPRPCIIGLDEPQVEALRARFAGPFLAFPTLPRILVREGDLFVQSPTTSRYFPTSRFVFHGIFEDDFDLIAGLALWGGPCLPNAVAMMDCRLKLPCLVRALRYSEFGLPPRGFASPGAMLPDAAGLVAKWGNWHCGENKERLTGTWTAEQPSILEPYLEGEALRVVVVGEQAWQVRLAGDDWRKSIHHDAARLMQPDARLVADTRRVAASFGLEIAANDYLVTRDGVPHLLETNHIPNVTRFPEIWEAYAAYVATWLARPAGRPDA